MSKKDVIAQTEEYVKKSLEDIEKGHDFSHIERVVRNSKKIAQKEGGDLFVIELGALLHDIADWKFNKGDHLAGSKKAIEWLGRFNLDPKIIDEVAYIVDNISYRGGTNKNKMRTLEGKIVQDADRLDALGAIGIARAFNFGGHIGRTMHDPKIKPMQFKDFKDYKKKFLVNTVINHFYEKLLLLKDKMNTKTAKKIAEDRHEFMLEFLRKFHAEWDK